MIKSYYNDLEKIEYSYFIVSSSLTRRWKYEILKVNFQNDWIDENTEWKDRIGIKTKENVIPIFQIYFRRAVCQ